MLCRSLSPIFGLLDILVAAQETTSISLHSTRVVFDGTHKEANIIVRNGNHEVLVQLWVDAGNSAQAPFAITPPLARVLPEQEHQNTQSWAWGVALPVSYLLFFKRATS
ncbi:fimbria/pilus periplasmic chaperone [Pseudomonas aeruginosa]